MIVHAHIACAAAASGLDCAVVVERDRAAVWQAAFEGHVTIASELPFGAMPEVTMPLAPESFEGARWIAPRAFAAGDFLPCARTTVRAELDGDGVLWRGSIELPRRGCVHPRMTVAVACDHVIECRGWQCGPHGPDDPYPTGAEMETEAVPIIECTLSFDPATSVPLRIYAVGAGDPETVDAHAPSGTVDVEDQGQRFDRIRVAVTTADGAIVWRGRAR